MSIDFYRPETIKIPELEKFVKRPHYLEDTEGVSFSLHFTSTKKYLRLFILFGIIV